ncbi:RhoGEF for Rho1 [Schizosaccharomyces cryophilus OY26]|uniref:RhoGEF for Rho1 n=1 Tax=Schizosaccharomyces cryophilus (strain OY26 / ATCC MYA-4695 / CBS 11777 / NBRC 106824 / NRRL Y48691) TaxID=653667 RepID=S9VWI6_SCHCR|nr:RhoGEF for Rho1 [Schizosaccharomyces cryophilus OY26]EPY50614.1 RhoGEF for Rho1 [Schizosaccharomyces cryophilus OY26]
MEYRHPNGLDGNEGSRVYEEIFGAPRKRDPIRAVSSPVLSDEAATRKSKKSPTRRIPRKPMPNRSASLQTSIAADPSYNHYSEVSPIKIVDYYDNSPSFINTSNPTSPLNDKGDYEFTPSLPSFDESTTLNAISKHPIPSSYNRNDSFTSTTPRRASSPEGHSLIASQRENSLINSTIEPEPFEESYTTSNASPVIDSRSNSMQSSHMSSQNPPNAFRSPSAASMSFRQVADLPTKRPESGSLYSTNRQPSFSSSSPVSPSTTMTSGFNFPISMSPAVESQMSRTSTPAHPSSPSSPHSKPSMSRPISSASVPVRGPSLPNVPTTNLRIVPPQQSNLRNHSFDHASIAHLEAMKQKRLHAEATSRSYTLSSYKSSGSATISDSSTYPSSPTAFVPSERSSPVGKGKKKRKVYAALLSRVAEELTARIQLNDISKDGLIYSNAFTGDYAVTLLMGIIHTSDRTLALLVGRSLDAQKFIHDVTYDHRLRDSHREIYQFQGIDYRRLIPHDAASPRDRYYRDHNEDSESSARNSSATIEDVRFPNGVFTLLTHCYSPTCAKDHPCYSISCPRRLEQQHRMFAKMRANAEQSSSLTFDDKEQKLWIHSVPKEIANSVSERERKRQEVICEVIYTERDFVKDLEYLRDYWIKPLWASNCINERKKEKFIRTVFLNALEVQAVNSKLAEALTRRQNYKPIVDNIADIFLEHVPKFEPFIRYGAGQLYGKYEFEKEKANNPAFAKFVYDVERMKESRKLELNGYLTKPTTRLARYPLLLEAVLKYTDEENSDKQDIPKVVNVIRGFLSRLNVESGKAENQFNLFHLNQQLVFKPGEHYDLHLLDANRQLIFKGPLKKKSATSSALDSSSDVSMFLFDHALLIVKPKFINKREIYKVYQRPIPLLLLQLYLLDEAGTRIPYSNKSQLAAVSKVANGKPPGRLHPFSLQLLGRRGYEITLFASTEVGRDKWLEHIDHQQTLLQHRSQWFESVTVSSDFFVNDNKVNAIGVYDSGRRLLYGTDYGVYVSLRKSNSPLQFKPVRALNISNVIQLEVIEEFNLLLLLSDKTLYSYPLEMIEADTSQAPKKPRKVCGHTTFFRVGICLGQVLVCAVKSSVLSATIKVFEPVPHLAKGKNMPSFKKLLAVNQDPLRIIKELYIPTESTSVHFLKNKLCVGCTRGFEVVSLDNLETQSLLDPADTSLEFAERKENVKPIAIYRMNGGEFLLCYTQFAFFVNRDGWRSRSTWFVVWEGNPQNFALSYPYILAFEPSFIEVRHVETSELVHVIPGNNIRLLADGRGKLGEGGEIFYACDQRRDNVDTSVVCSLRLTSANADVHVKEALTPSK